MLCLMVSLDSALLVASHSEFCVLPVYCFVSVFDLHSAGNCALTSHGSVFHLSCLGWVFNGSMCSLLVLYLFGISTCVLEIYRNYSFVVEKQYIAIRVISFFSVILFEKGLN